MSSDSIILIFLDETPLVWSYFLFHIKGIIHPYAEITVNIITIHAMLCSDGEKERSNADYLQSAGEH